MTLLPDIGIIGTGSYLPEQVVTADELAQTLDTTGEWILQRTGIAERRFAAADQSTSDLGVHAVRSALDAAGRSPTDVDLLVCATSSPDWMQPATASAIHGGVGMRPDAGAMDLNVVCSGFVYALHAGAAMLASQEGWNTVAVVGAECYSRITNPTDRSTRVLFGDGAGAVILGRVDGSAIESVEYGTDFSRAAALVVPAGGAREPVTAAAIDAGRTFFTMDGPVVKAYAIEVFVPGVRAACASAGIDVGDIDHVIPHQSNLRILERCMGELGVERDRVHLTVDRYGNTAAASIPITLDEAVRSGGIARGQHVCLIGYGGGLTWASMMLRW